MEVEEHLLKGVIASTDSIFSRRGYLLIGNTSCIVTVFEKTEVEWKL